MLWRGAHLSYCMNIHPGESWDENLLAIETHAAQVKLRVSPDGPFGLGLRLSARAAGELAGRLDEFRGFMDKAGMYAFTVNGFPYGAFHGERVKEAVYLPDWTAPERLAYTMELARILAALVPEGVAGSISTVPVAYGKIVDEAAVANLIEAAEALARIEDETGRTVLLALEPEPDCAVETTGEALALFDTLHERGGDSAGRHLGICLDACHMACQFEDPAESLARLESAGVPVPKVHVSSALAVPEGAGAPGLLAPFADPVYFHQTRVLSAGSVARYADLPDALDARPEGEWRVHFHVPLDFEGADGLESTSGMLGDSFFDAVFAPGRHVEIETYTLGVMPAPRRNVVESIAAEFAWLMGRAPDVR